MIPEIKDIVKAVKTKKWARLHKSQLDKYADKYTNVNRSDLMITGGMLHAAYGVNIGEQVLSKLTSTDLVKIRYNVIQAYLGR